MQGDFVLGKTVYVDFNTCDPTGLPVTLAGTPTVSVYENGSLTQTTAGVSLSVDLDGLTGFHQVSIDTSSDGTFYAAARDFKVVITAGTVNGVSVVGTVVGEFSLLARSGALEASLQALITTVGAAGAGLTATASAVWAVATRLLTAGTNIVLAKGTGVTGFNDIAASAIIDDATPFHGASIAGIKAQTDKLAFTVANQIDANVVDWKGATAPAMTGDAFARLGAPAGASVSADVAAVKVDTAAIKAQTDNLPADPADESLIIAATSALSATLGSPAGASLAADIAAVKAVDDAVKAKTDNLPASPAAVSDIPTAAENADKLLGRTIAGGADGGRTVKDALRFSRNKVAISGSTISVYAEDDTTVAWSGTISRSAADAIQSVDPA